MVGGLHTQDHHLAMKLCRSDPGFFGPLVERPPANNMSFQRPAPNNVPSGAPISVLLRSCRVGLIFLLLIVRDQLNVHFALMKYSSSIALIWVRDCIKASVFAGLIQ
ncbi:uncharacterized protein LOC121050175 isoform X2 [Rosa chinensis]|uniref:uncharacterized protein LOC121050175 isoform X2 n=1 Tax=Rosa chinensis TaxID=74649 RepID=UPI001AD90DD4|nr:uncharacterized protein LOC121050175 isoform X2 [Rosa chinensis]